MLRVLLRCIGCSGLLLLGCSSDKGGGGGSGGTTGAAGMTGGGIPGTTQLSMTTAAERVSLCETHRTDIQASAAQYCVTTGIGMSSKAMCETARDTCVGKIAVNCNTNFGDLKGCTVTLSQFESCFTEIVAWTKTLTCDNFDKMPAKLPACVPTLDANCPGALAMLMP